MSELSTIELNIVLPEGAKLSQSAGSIFHGVLMQNIDKNYAETLHRQQLRPYSQYIFYDREQNKLLWRISSLNQEAYEEILIPLLSITPNIFLEQKGWAIQIKDRNFIKQTTYEKIAEKYFTITPDAKAVGFKFLTSCSFKTNGEYAIFPQPTLVTKSLVNKWNFFSLSDRLDEKGIAFDLAKELYVANYDLKLQRYALEGINIPAFRGKYSLGFKNNIMIKKIMCMLAEFSEFSGIGIKTALGMGATKINFEKW